jgi:hypothetical protein
VGSPRSLVTRHPAVQGVLTRLVCSVPSPAQPYWSRSWQPWPRPRRRIDANSTTTITTTTEETSPSRGERFFRLLYSPTELHRYVCRVDSLFLSRQQQVAGQPLAKQRLLTGASGGGGGGYGGGGGHGGGYGGSSGGGGLGIIGLCQLLAVGLAVAVAAAAAAALYLTITAGKRRRRAAARAAGQRAGALLEGRTSGCFKPSDP